MYCEQKPTTKFHHSAMEINTNIICVANIETNILQ